MQTSQKVTKLSCEQIYNIWSSEPFVLKLLDLRTVNKFNESHIPGAKNIKPEALNDELTKLGDKLAVIITSESQEDQLKPYLESFSNYVFMNECHRWFILNQPIVGENIKLKIEPSNNKKGLTMKNDIIFYQLFEQETSTYTYIIADSKTKEAAIIDPVIETVDRDLKLIEELELNLIYILDTHIHADHITGAGELRKRTQAKTGVSHKAEVSCVDIPLEEGQELLLGDKKIRVIATPGHTNTCVSYLFEGMIFTGDSLMIRGCGRTDFQQGSSEKLFESVHEKIFKLPNDTVIYPGHDYRGQTSSTVQLEKKFNPRLGESKAKDDFVKIMSELKLANPKKIHEAVPANLLCGQLKEMRALHPQKVDGIPEITCDDLFSHLSKNSVHKIRLVDVRRPDEFNNELGHVQGAELVTLGPDLTKFLEQGNRNEEIVFLCRSGGRSGAATSESIQLGYKFTINMTGGMIRWNEKKFPVERK